MSIGDQLCNLYSTGGSTAKSLLYTADKHHHPTSAFRNSYILEGVGGCVVPGVFTISSGLLPFLFLCHWKLYKMSPQSSSGIPENASTTSDGHVPVSRKRKRNVLSCLDCRRRKVKCDHGLPACSRCRQRGVASSCTYEYSLGDEYGHQGESAIPADEDLSMTAKAPEPPTSGHPDGPITTHIPPAPMSAYLEQRDTITRLENRLKILEAAVANGRSGPSAPPEPDPQREIPKQLEANFFKGRGFRTQFYGASCPSSILASVCLTSRSLRL